MCHLSAAICLTPKPTATEVKTRVTYPPSAGLRPGNTALVSWEKEQAAP